MKVYVGIDWGKRESVASFGLAGDKPKRAKVATDYSGAAELVAKIKQTCACDDIKVVIEAGSRRFSEALMSLDCEVHVVDCKQARKFVESLTSSEAKSDSLDSRYAWLMAQSPVHLSEPSSPVAPLDAAISRQLRHLEWVCEDRVRATNRLRATLSEDVPEIERHIRSFDAQYARDLVREVPTAWHAARFTQADWAEFVSKHRVPKGKRTSFEHAIDASGRFVVDEELTATSKRRIVVALVAELELLLQQEKDAEAELKRLTDEHEASVIETIPGVGTKTLANVVTRLFPNGAEADRDAAAKRGSAAPVRVQTGDTKNVVKFRRGNSPKARAATYCLGLQAIRRHAWAKAQYDHARSRGKSAALAFRQVARSLLRIINALLKHKVPYDEARYIKALKAHGVAWAMDLPSASTA